MVELLHPRRLPAGDLHRAAVRPSFGIGGVSIGVEDFCGRMTSRCEGDGGTGIFVTVTEGDVNFYLVNALLNFLNGCFIHGSFALPLNFSG